jgi:orotidine-5'-phosphate decarboxylase
MREMIKKYLFDLDHGVIPACDVNTLQELESIVKNTCSIDGIVGYKVGFSLALTYGLSQLNDAVKQYTNLPIIYDHQKAGTDIPQMGKQFAKVCKKGGVTGVIIFPQAGPVTEKEFIIALKENNLVPIVGGEMTHTGYLYGENGFLRDDAPLDMYRVGAQEGAEYFVVPGNRIGKIRTYRILLSNIIKYPRFCFPGIGRQGGDIKRAFEATGNYPAYAIIGSGIYKQSNMKEAARTYCKEALAVE